uniref:Uncharacterized protein n=1 Tax=Tanacetum cinerariifolium TaxID=118510 RepID=A0A699S2T0_TANCI|nr:hypothetical protein [Tanacetum cinerariifolium]
MRHPFIVSCLSSLGESLLSVTVADSQSLGVLPSLSAASESGSHATVAVPGVLEVDAISGTASAGSIQVSLILYPTSLIPQCLISASTVSINP